MRDLVIWTGPVALFQVTGATLPGALELNLQCLSDRTPFCGRLASSFQRDGRMLPRLLASAGLSEQELGTLAIGAFSAGGILVKRLLMDERDRARVTAVHLADATYTAQWVNKSKRIPTAIEGFVRYALDAIDGLHLFVATASPNPNKSWATGIENLAAIRHEVEKRSGRRFEEQGHFFGIEPAPSRVYKLGNVIFAEFPRKPLGHGHTKIADQVWERIIRPWVEEGYPGAPSQAPLVPTSHEYRLIALRAWDAVAFLAAFGAGYSASRLVLGESE